MRHNIYSVEVSVNFRKIDVNSLKPAENVCHMCAHISKKFFEHKKYLKRIYYHINERQHMRKEKYQIEISADFIFLLIFQLISPNFKYL